MKRHTQKLHPIRKGVVAVEFAVVLPVILLFISGLVEFGQAFQISHVMSSASRRGVRMSTLDGTTKSQVEQAIQTQCNDTLNVSASDVSVTIEVNDSAATPLTSAQQDDKIEVVITIPYSKAGVGFFANFLTSITLRSVCTMEHE